MRTTKAQLEAFANTPIGADLADAVELLRRCIDFDVENDGDVLPSGMASDIADFLREPEGEVVEKPKKPEFSIDISDMYYDET